MSKKFYLKMEINKTVRRMFSLLQFKYKICFITATIWHGNYFSFSV